ncbi:MAG: GNAT family N-acetyltransferase [Oscillospiraceae bacterium]|nr:GNAT family N-acetyltransferase [Oscillospiraceae bacterium]
MMKITKESKDNELFYLLHKETDIIGYCHMICGSVYEITSFTIKDDYTRRGYGTYLLKQVLRETGGYEGSTHRVVPATQAHRCFFQKHGFYGEETMQRRLAKQLVPLEVVHHLLAQYVKPGDFVVDATAGLGRDTAYLCRLVGNGGKVLSFDIQQEAVDKTNALLKDKGLSHIGEAVLLDHADMGYLIRPESAAAVVFNFGYLPGGDHEVFSLAKSSIKAIDAALDIVRPGGVVVLCLYSGGPNGFDEKNAILEHLAGLPTDVYTVIACNFHNRKQTSPMPVLIVRDK